MSSTEPIKMVSSWCRVRQREDGRWRVEHLRHPWYRRWFGYDPKWYAVEYYETGIWGNAYNTEKAALRQAYHDVYTDSRHTMSENVLLSDYAKPSPSPLPIEEVYVVGSLERRGTNREKFICDRVFLKKEEAFSYAREQNIQDTLRWVVMRAPISAGWWDWYELAPPQSETQGVK